MIIFTNILFVLFAFAIIVQLFFALYFFLRISLYKQKESTFSDGVSIIICVKDEKENLERNLSSILNQDYPKYEVIIVNDQSIDGTKYLLQDLEKRHSNLRVVTIDEHINSRVGKKFALTIGIKTAKFDYVILSDADCKAHSKYWIQKMSCQFMKKDIVLGISPYEHRKGLLNKFIRFDEFQISLQYLSFALAGIPYMGVGRNLAYKKSLFFDVKGFASHIHIPSGDDDLFIQEVANKDNVTIQIDEQADIFSIPKESFSSWIHQKRRHVSTSTRYHFKHKLLLFLLPLSQFLFWIPAILLFIFSNHLILTFSLFIFRLSLYYIVYYNSMKKLRSFDLYFIYPLMEFFYLLVQLFFVLLNPINISNRWK